MIKENAVRIIFLFLVGGYSYCLLEVLFRGYSHISMLFAGGLSFLLVGEVYENVRDFLPLPIIMLIGMVIITSIELVIGMIVNINMKLNVWDYSMYKYNYKGQICLLFSCCWYVLSFFLVKLFHAINIWTLGANERGSINFFH